MKDIEVIAFDADDTLWDNEPFFQEIERRYAELLDEYGDAENISDELFRTEMSNLERFGYGAKSFTLSMIETALRISNRKVPAPIIAEVLNLGKSLLDMPIKLLPGVEKTLNALKQKGCYRLVVATKGDLVDQQRKLQRSGLIDYFDHIEIMPDKTESEYRALIGALQTSPDKFLMVGNSLKSDIQPVLSIGGYAVHIPYTVMWQHEVMEDFRHPNLIQINKLEELTGVI